MNITERIKEWMKEEKLTYEELASRIGWTRQNLWLKMNMGTHPNFDAVRKIIEATGHRIKVVPIDNYSGEVNLDKIYDATAEEKQVSFEIVEELFNAIGYEFRFEKTQ